MIRNKNKFNVFNDGVVRIFSAENNAENGRQPVLELTHKCDLWYEERTVGLTRHFAAKQANVEISYLLRCPLWRDISTQMVAMMWDGKIYRIEQVQIKKDSTPRAMDLSLVAIEQRFALANPEEGGIYGQP